MGLCVFFSSCFTTNGVRKIDFDHWSKLNSISVYLEVIAKKKTKVDFDRLIGPFND